MELRPSVYCDKWKRIAGWDDYCVHPNGFVKSVKNNKHRILSTFYVGGYSAVNLVMKNPKRRKSARLHILVAEAFIGPRQHGCDVMHLDGNSKNPQLENLRYGSKSCNEAFKIDHGTALVGERHHQAKLSRKDVLEIRNRLDSGDTGAEIARDYNMSTSMIIRIKNNRSWTCV